MAAVVCSLTFRAGPLGADEPDAIRTELEKAKKVRGEADAKARAGFLAAFDDAIKTVAGLGDLDGVKALQAEKKAFEESGKLPASARVGTAGGEYQKAAKAALAALEKAYDQAIKDSTKALKIEQAEAIRAEWKENQAPNSAVLKPEKGPGGPIRPAAIASKSDLKRALTGTVWDHGDADLTLRADGHVQHAVWDRMGLVTRWEPVDRRTIVLVIEKGRDHNRCAILTFNEDLTDFTGYGFEGATKYQPGKKRRK
jgi:hypothetical protein